ncbi:spore maturation protein CgeB [Butyrivibrio sp. X503]|nr:spore maturation protein CgeB [Butyrivibrio sp. X503]
MNVIVYRYDSICEPDYIDALKAVGLTIIEDNTGRSEHDSMTLDERITNLGNLIAEHRPLFIFSINFFPFIAMLCERIKVPYVCVSVDCPVLEIYNNAIKSPYNRVFLFDKKQYESVAYANPNCIFHLPLGGAVDRMNATTKGAVGYDFDISFIGSLYTEKDPYAALKLPSGIESGLEEKMLRQLKENIYGLEYVENTLTDEEISAIKDADPEFYSSRLSIRNLDRQIVLDDYLGSHITVLERKEILNTLAESIGNYKLDLFTTSNTKELSPLIRNRGIAKSFTEMPIIFKKSKINLNTTMRAIRSGLPQRIWDILACGGFLLTNYQPELDEFLTPGVHLETYRSIDELVEKSVYYLEHDDEREAIAQNGYKKICEEDSVLHRVMAMIRIVMEAHK